MNRLRQELEERKQRVARLELVPSRDYADEVILDVNRHMIYVLVKLIHIDVRKLYNSLVLAATYNVSSAGDSDRRRMAHIARLNNRLKKYNSQIWGHLFSGPSANNLSDKYPEDAITIPTDFLNRCEARRTKQLKFESMLNDLHYSFGD